VQEKANQKNGKKRRLSANGKKGGEKGRVEKKQGKDDLRGAGASRCRGNYLGKKPKDLKQNSVERFKRGPILT